ncbi:FecR domain-containing protein [Acetobacter suratthaniensis]|uniref:FecR domain-containing protein n=1 Tax=Acetobacter suratthaniensis TaxID=1502841 RepID=A0ABS3LNY5_9PROT|nr:FecR domain-containing protein [Acetobacter suratthaniensis]MBO1329068.1 FecR domain-containing protein [Acetobacter suratthaniensis]MCX2566911.1 FecR domain-containing protein [Acetobacter suratthaniensis]
MAEAGRGWIHHRTPRNIALSDEAIEWLVVLHSGRSSDTDRNAYAEWRQRSPAHEEAAREAEILFGQSGNTTAAGDYQIMGDALAAPPYQQRARRLGRRALGASLVAGITAWIAGPAFLSSITALLATYHTAVGERRQIRLGDGSSIWLNTATSLSVEFTERQRSVILHAGEALFDVVRDQMRPFVVRSGNGEAEALGTVYAVKRDGATTNVSVQTGAVAVRDGEGEQRVEAGESVRYGDGIVSAPVPVDMADLTSWTRGKLIFNQKALVTVALELGRYRHSRILVIGHRLREMKITGVFDIDDNEALLTALETSAGARITRLPYLLMIH